MAVNRTRATARAINPAPDASIAENAGENADIQTSQPFSEDTPTMGALEPEAAQSGGDEAENRSPETAPPDPPSEPGTVGGDVFTQAARARKERGTRKGPVVKKKPPRTLKTVSKTKAWFRTHPAATYPGLTIYQDPTSEEIEEPMYYVTPDLEDELWGVEGVKTMTAYLLATAGGAMYLMLVPEASDGSRISSAAEEKHSACMQAQTAWTRMSWDGDAKQYDTFEAEWDKEPKWPEDLSEETILRLAFGKAVIDDPKHPILQKLSHPA
jgi:hypothetical protein